jgi:ligand-binding SRPBCC domain-containing protein
VAKIILRTEINAPAERCFDLSRSIDLHQKSTAQTQERAIAGRTSGLIELGETVTWRAKHFGFWQELTSKITAFDYPNTFTDEMVKGIFKRIHHIHRFESVNQKTIMIDEFAFELPAGFVGRILGSILIRRYLEKLLIERNSVIKAYAEGDEWRKFIPYI